MVRYDNDYRFVTKASDDRLPEMTSDRDTGARQYGLVHLPVGSKPLMVNNGFYDLQKDMGVTPMDPPPPILFDGPDMLVDDAIRDKLVDADLYDVSLHPAIYIDHLDNWHEHYWFVTVLNEIDCWDRAVSRFNPKPVGSGANKTYSVFRYSLDDSVLDPIPLEKRLLFRMGGTTTGPIVAHVSIANFFNKDGATLKPISKK